ncbi:MAG: diguanylate cyclase, partial [Lachnospiraceae bacterium]|nr:diguanylate cyclase [Lachnospiraceae bacterium]
IFLGVIMVGNPEAEISSVSRESAMAALQEILRKNLRRGDIVTRFSQNIFAMLLTTVSYSTGDLVMKRIEEMFYEEYHNKNIIVHHRISPLGTKVS